MGPQSADETAREFQRAVQEIAEDNSLGALARLERALRSGDNLRWHSYLGYCIARERGQVRKGIDLCLSSLELEPDNPEHYLNLGKVHLISGNKDEALRVFREGMTRTGSATLADLLERLGTRKPPVISFLSRDNLINRFLGLLLVRLGLR